MPKPATQRPTLPSVGRLGLVEPPARADLTRLGWDTDAHVELLWSLSRAPDADTALRTMVRLADALGDDWDELSRALLKDRGLRGRLFGVLGSSMALGDHLVAQPRSWHLLAGNVTLPSLATLHEVFANRAENSMGANDLRVLYRDRLLVLTGLDVAPTVENEPVVPFPTVGAHLADLADAALGAALIVATKVVCKDADHPPPRLAVIAMGKCGARELNYVSDVDVIFVGEKADSVTTRVAGEMMRFAGDAFFEVDAALRPEGKRGQLVRTLESHVAYYERWAKTWEFQALLKARPAVGDAELGDRYVAALMPMVWTACEREAFVSEVQAMRRRVEELVPAGVRARELKLGTGGLRTWSSRYSCCSWSMVATTTPCTSRRRSTPSLHLVPADTSGVTTPRISLRPTSFCVCSSTAYNCSGSSAPICSPRPTTRRRCGGWPAPPTCGRTASTTRWACCGWN